MESNFYPLTQRRLRTGSHIRELVSTVKLSHHNFIQPLFADEVLTAPRAVNGLNEISVDTTTSILQTIETNIANGITKFLLFPVPAARAEKSFDFSFAVSLLKKIRQAFGNDIWIAADLCLCSYTTHGHCGILNADHSHLLNSQTVDTLSHYAALLGNAGADCIAPSDMMDGRIAAIRTKLDALGYEQVSIMSYAAKFSSQFYGPFRDACHSAPNTTGLQNRKTYQLSPFNPGAAVAAAVRDEREGADIVMVKPAALYTDIISEVRRQVRVPVAAYHVSGEYAAVEALAANGLVNRESAHLEVWAALERSGAGIIISYAAKHAKKWISEMAF